MDAKDIKDHSQWAIALVVAGGALAVPAIVAGNKQALLIGLGMICYGVGQMRNRQAQQSLHFDPFGRIVAKTTRYPHRFTLVGTTLSALGLALFSIGLWRLIAS